MLQFLDLNIKSTLHFNRYKRLIHYCQGTKFEGYVEKHHILPKSLYPEYSDDPENVISVTPRIHFILHYLLWKSFRNREMWFAFKCMRARTKNHKHRYVNSLLFASLKNSITFSEEHKRKISKSCKGKIVTEETKRKMSAWQKGKPKKTPRGPHSAETRQKISMSQQKVKHLTSHFGSDNNMSKPITLGTNEYVSITECSRLTGISTYNLRKYIASNNPNIRPQRQKELLLSLLGH